MEKWDFATLLLGPQLEGNGVSQDEVDRMMDGEFAKAMAPAKDADEPDAPSTAEQAVKAGEGQASEEAGTTQRKVSSTINSRSGSSLPSKT